MMHLATSSHNHEHHEHHEPTSGGHRAWRGQVWWLLLLAGAAALLVRTVFFVDETEYVYVTQFGEPIYLCAESGLGVKWPYQSLRRFDRRLRLYEPPPREMLTQDKENLNFEWFVCWRIPSRNFRPNAGFARNPKEATTIGAGLLTPPSSDRHVRASLDEEEDEKMRAPRAHHTGLDSNQSARPETEAPRDQLREGLETYVRRFLQSVGTSETAERRLEERIQAAIAAEIGRVRLSQLVSLEPEQLVLADIGQRVTRAMGTMAAEEFGIEVVDVRLKRFSYPEAVKPAVYAEIRSERERVAVQYRAEGASEKAKIESLADLQRDQLLAQAQREATKIRGEGEAKAIEIANAAHAKNPEFFEFLKTLETYRTILDNQTTVVLSAESPLLKLLTQGLPERMRQTAATPEAAAATSPASSGAAAGTQSRHP